MSREWAIRVIRGFCAIDKPPVADRKEAAVAANGVCFFFFVYHFCNLSGCGLLVLFTFAFVLHVDSNLVLCHAGVAVGFVVTAADGEIFGLGKGGGRSGEIENWKEEDE